MNANPGHCIPPRDAAWTAVSGLPKTVQFRLGFRSVSQKFLVQFLNGVFLQHSHVFHSHVIRAYRAQFSEQSFHCESLCRLTRTEQELTFTTPFLVSFWPIVKTV